MTEIWSLDSALPSPTDESFFNEDSLQAKQHFSKITSQLASDDWSQPFDDIGNIEEIWDGIGIDLTFANEPGLSPEAMNKEVVTLYESKANECFDCLDSTIFMSPQSLEPSSPQSINTIAVDLHLDSVVDPSDIPSDIAWETLEEILSANSSDSEYISDQSLDTELSLQSVIEVSKDQEVDQKEETETRVAPKRQYKRKLQSNETPVKSNKRSKTTITERKERKRNQNKSAANRYRQKKRAEMDGIEQQQESFQEVNNRLKAELQKLQMEFKVVFPLAKAAFAADPNKTLQLDMLDIRVLTENLLE